MRVVVELQDGVRRELPPDHPTAQFVGDFVARYRAAGLAPSDLAADLTPVDLGCGHIVAGLVHWADDAKVSPDWNNVVIYAAWASADELDD